jgi:uncharacterized protein YyaL (SSP411 family)
MNELFWDEERETFYDTPTDHETLITRPRDVYDNAAPSGTSVAADVLLRLALLLDRDDYRVRAETVLEGLSGGMEKLPSAFGRLLAALDFHLSRPKEVALVGGPEAEDTKTLLSVIFDRYLPNKVVAGRWCRLFHHPAPRRPPDARWSGHRLRLRRLRLPESDHRSGRTAEAAHWLMIAGSVELTPR